MQSFTTESYRYPVAGFRLVMNSVPNPPITGNERILRLASESAVVVFSVNGCCMSHVVKRLLLGLGVSPAFHELDQEPGGDEMLSVLRRILGVAQPVPAVFVGGKLIGGLESVMSRHINGSLVPLLKSAGALWL